MIDTTTILFILAYIIYAYYIKRTSSWFYALFTSILWAAALHAHVLLNAHQIMAIVTGAVPLSDFAADWVLQIVMYNLGGIIIAIFYIWPVWGLNRAKWLVLILAMYPTVLILPIAVIGIISFHIFDLLFWGPIKGDTIRSQHNHVGYRSDDYTLDE